MSDVREQVRRYRDRAEECRRSAEASPPQIAAHYRRIAEIYLELADELEANGKIRPSTDSGIAGPDA